MTQRTIVIRPTVRFYQEKPELGRGFSGRAAYALGFDRPNYPVPAPIYEVEFLREYNRCTDVLFWERKRNNPNGLDCWDCVYSYLDTKLGF